LAEPLLLGGSAYAEFPSSKAFSGEAQLKIDDSADLRPTCRRNVLVNIFCRFITSVISATSGNRQIWVRSLPGKLPSLSLSTQVFLKIHSRYRSFPPSLSLHIKSANFLSASLSA
jgi:hypothetical protein